MQTRSALFDVAVRDGAPVISKVDILNAGKVVPGGAGIEISGGSVVADRGPFVRRSLDLVVPGQEYAALLDPYKGELRVWSGFVLPNGASEYVPMGTFGVQSVDDDLMLSPDATQLAGSGFRVVGADRCQRVVDYNFAYPYTVVEGVSAVGVLRSLLAAACPWAQLLVAPGIEDVLAPVVTWDQSRVDAVNEIARSLAAEVYSDRYGDFVLAPVPTVDDPPVWDVSALGGVLVSRKRTRSRKGVINGVVSRGTTSSADKPAPVGNLITNNDPYSPTYWGTGTGLDSPFGRVTRRFSSPWLQSVEQADNASRSILADSAGLAVSVSFEQVPQFALDPGDVVSGVPADGSLSSHLLERIDADLGPGLLSCDTRTTSTTEV